MKKFLAFLLAVTVLFQAIPMYDAEAQTTEQTSVMTDAQQITTEQTDEEAPVILGEVTSERTETTKTFYLSDGSYMLAEYPVAVHTMTENEEWQEINSGTETNSASVLTTAESQVNLSQNNGTLSWHYLDADLSDAEVCTDSEEGYENDEWLAVEHVFTTRLYHDVYENVDLKVTTGNHYIKEDLILKKKGTRNTFQVEYRIGSLQAIEGENIITLVNAEQEVVYTLTAPLMYDASGAVSEAVTLSLSSAENGRITVTMTADSGWLNQEERVYPVVVDPVVTTNQNAAEVLSRYYVSGTYHAAHGTLYVGLQKNGLGTVSSALKFTLPELESSDIILNAQLHLAQRDLKGNKLTSNSSF